MLLMVGMVIAGNFSQLNTEFLVTAYGLIQTVDRPTHGDSLLDLFFVNLSGVYSVAVFKSH